MNLRYVRLLLILVLLTSFSARAEEITTRRDAVGRSLQQWWDAGTAAGFDALMYENHDGGALAAAAADLPSAADAEAERGRDQGGPGQGAGGHAAAGGDDCNTSMSGPAAQVGSLPRVYLTDPGGSEFLFKQYVGEQPPHLPGTPGLRPRCGRGGRLGRHVSGEHALLAHFTGVVTE